MTADVDDLAVYGVGLKQLDCWDREFEFPWGHRFSALVFVVCRVGVNLCDDLITH